MIVSATKHILKAFVTAPYEDIPTTSKAASLALASEVTSTFAYEVASTESSEVKKIRYHHFP
jgi:hypothetical protein